MCHHRILRVKVHAVSGDLAGLNGVRLPGEALFRVINIVVGLCRLHQGEPCLILLIRGHRIVVCRQLIGNFEQIRYSVLFGRILFEHRKQILFPEVTGMIDDNILDDLDALGMGGIDQILIRSSRRFITRIDLGEIDRVISVIIIPAGILYDRSDPDRAEAKRFDVIKLLNQPLKIASPGRV
ncbi:hypothetical protein D3C73_1280350 [compost metagenome]